MVELRGLPTRVGRPLEAQVCADGILGFPVEGDDPIGPRLGLRAAYDEMAGLIAATIGRVARALVSLATNAVISVLLVCPLSAFAAIFTRIPGDAVAASLDGPTGPTDDTGDRALTTRTQPAQSLSSQEHALLVDPVEHALGDTVWDGDSGRMARVAGIDQSSYGATYELAYADGSRRKVSDGDVEKWSPAVEPELQRSHELLETFREVRRLQQEERMAEGNKQPDSKQEG